MQKEKISVAIFSPNEMLRLKKRAACSLCGIATGICAQTARELALRRAIGDAGCDRLQRCGAAAPAAVDLLKRKRLLDPDAIGHGKTVAAVGRHRSGLAGLQVPARSGAVRCDRAADRER